MITNAVSLKKHIIEHEIVLDPTTSTETNNNFDFNRMILDTDGDILVTDYPLPHRVLE